MRYFRVLILSLVLMMLLANISPATAQNITDDDTLISEIGRGEVQYVFWHPDGTKFYVQTAHGAIWIYDRATLTEIGHLETGNYGSITPSGRWIRVYRPDDKRWDLFSSSDFTQVEIEVINFSPDGRFILVSDTDGAIRLVDGETLLPVTDISFPTDNLIWSPDSTKFASRLQTGEVQIWGMDEHGDFVERATFSATVEARLKWSPDSTKLAYHLQTGEIQIWEMAERGDFVEGAIFGTSGDTKLEWSPDSTRIIQYDYQGVGGIYSVADGELITSTPPSPIAASQPESDYSFVQWMPDGTRYILMYVHDYGNGNGFGPISTIIDAQNGEVVFDIPADQFGPAEFTPDGLMILSSGIYEAKTLELVHQIYSDNTRYLSPDGTKLLTTYYIGKGFHIYDVATGQKLATILYHPNRNSIDTQPSGSYLANWSPDSQEVLVWEDSGLVSLINGATGQVLHKIYDFNPLGNGIKYSTDSSLVAIADFRGSVYIYDTATGMQQSVLARQHQDPVTTILWSPDNTFVATKSDFNGATSGTEEEETKVMIWDAIHGNHLYTIDHIDRPDDMVWHPDGDYFASASDKYLTLWYPPPHQPFVQQWSDGVGESANLKFCPNKEFLLITSSTPTIAGKTLMVRDAETFEPLDFVNITQQEVYCTEEGYVLGAPTILTRPQYTLPGRVVFSPDGKTYVHAWQGVIELYRVGE